jgi:glyoxylate reductase
MGLKPKVVVARMTPGIEESPLFAECDVFAWREDRLMPKELLAEQVGDAEGLVTSAFDVVNEAVLAQAPRLRVVSQFAVGLDNLDVKALTARGVPVGYTPFAVTEATADMALALMLSLSRRIVPSAQFVRAKLWRDWSPTLMIANDVFGKTLGIVGMGRIGQAIARRARGFNMTLLYHARNRRSEAEQALGVQYRSYDQILAESDILIFILPLSPETRYMVNDAAFAKMKKSAMVINVARGPIVDPKALYRALSSGRIAAAALDVTDPEPVAPDDPLLTLENLLITPHVATSTWETRREMTRVTVTNLLNGLAGKPMLHCANPEAQRAR